MIAVIVYGRGWRAMSFDVGHQDGSSWPIDVGGWTNYPKNRLLRRLSRPEPSILSRYCSLSSMSTVNNTRAFVLIYVFV